MDQENRSSSCAHHTNCCIAVLLQQGEELATISPDNPEAEGITVDEEEPDIPEEQPAAEAEPDAAADSQQVTAGPRSHLAPDKSVPVGLKCALLSVKCCIETVQADNEKMVRLEKFKMTFAGDEQTKQQHASVDVR